MPRPGSKLINGGDASICQGEDQRGVSIPFGVGCDIGAVESTATLMSLENLIKNLQINSGSDPDFEFNLDDDGCSDFCFTDGTHLHHRLYGR